MDKDNYKLLQEVKELLEIQTYSYFVLLKNALRENYVLGNEWVSLDMEFWTDGAISGIIGKTIKDYLETIEYVNKENKYDVWKNLYLIQGYASGFDDGLTLYYLKEFLQNKKYT